MQIPTRPLRRFLRHSCRVPKDHREQGMEVLRRPAEGRPGARRRLVAACWSCAACCRPCSPSPWACWSAPCSTATRSAARWRFVGIVFVAAAGARRRSTRPSSANLGDRTAAWLYDRLTDACVRPPGMGHLEDPQLDERPHRGARLRSRHDRAAAVDLDGLHRRRAGRDDRRARLGAACSFGYALVGAARCSPARGWRRTGCCARARSGTTATPTRCARAQRDADYAYRLAVDPPAAKELRLFGLVGWVDRALRRRGARGCTSCSTRPPGCARSRCCGACCWCSAANVLVFWSLADAAAERPDSPRRAR